MRRRPRQKVIAVVASKTRRETVHVRDFKLECGHVQRITYHYRPTEPPRSVVCLECEFDSVRLWHRGVIR